MFKRAYNINPVKRVIIAPAVLLLLLYCLPLIFNTYSGGFTSFINQNVIFLYILIFCLINQILDSKIISNFSLNLSSIDLILLIYFTLVTTRIFFGHFNVFFSEKFQTQVVLFLLFVHLKNMFQKKENINILVAVLLFIGLFCFLYSIIQLFQPIIFGLSKLGVVNGMFNNSGIFAGYLVAIIPLFFIATNNETVKKGFRNFLFLLCLLLVCTICLTQSRAGIIAVVISGVLLAFKQKRLVGQYYIYLLSILALCIIVLLCLLYYKHASLNGRNFILKITLQLCNQTSFWGSGYGSFDVLYNNLQSQYFLSGKATIEEVVLADIVHFAFNEFLQMYVELGLPIVIVYASLILTLSNLKSQSKNKYFVLTSLVGTNIFAFFSYPFHIFSINLICVTSLVILSVNEPPVFRIIGNKVFQVTLKGITVVILLILTGVQCLKIKNGFLWKQAYQISEYHPYQALPIYASILFNMNNNAAYLLDYGRLLNNLKYYKKSVCIIDHSMSLEVNLDSYLLQADNFSNLNHPEAEKYYVKATSLIPSKLFPKYDLMRYYLKIHHIENAIKVAYLILKTNVKIQSVEAEMIKKEARMILYHYNQQLNFNQ